MHDEGKEVECISEISFLLDVIYFSGKKEPAGFYYNMYAQIVTTFWLLRPEFSLCVVAFGER